MARFSTKRGGALGGEERGRKKETHSPQPCLEDVSEEEGMADEGR